MDVAVGSLNSELRIKHGLKKVTGKKNEILGRH
jgi:hypothetical protein